jgi:hypothetical protein
MAQDWPPRVTASKYPLVPNTLMIAERRFSHCTNVGISPKIQVMMCGSFPAQISSRQPLDTPAVPQ